MPEIVLYGHPVSVNTHRVRLLLSLLGVPFEETVIDLAKGEHSAPAFLALSSFGQVPLLRDGSLVLNESYAILTYLARKHGEERGEALWPSGYVDQSLVARWLYFSAGPLHHGVGLARNELRFGRPSGLEFTRPRAKAAFATLEAWLNDRDWLELDRPTLADVSVYPFVAVGPEIGLELADYPALSAWIGRLSSLDGFVAMPRLPDRAAE